MDFIHALIGMLLMTYFSIFRKSELNIIFPEENLELNQVAIDIAPFYSEYSRIKKCNLIFIKGSLNKYDFTKIKTEKKCIFKIVSESSYYVFCILKFWALCRNSNNNIIISFNYPFKTNNLGLLKKNNLSLKELVCYDIYHLTYIPEDKGW